MHFLKTFIQKKKDYPRRIEDHEKYLYVQQSSIGTRFIVFIIAVRTVYTVKSLTQKSPWKSFQDRDVD